MRRPVTPRPGPPMRFSAALLVCASALALGGAAAQTPPGTSTAGEQADQPRNPGPTGAAAPRRDATGGMQGFTPASAAAERELERRFDGLIDPKELDGWLKRMTAGPNHVGAPHNRENAEWQLAQFRSWGWDARIETFDVLYPTPKEVGLELLGPRGYKAKLFEPPVKGDRTSGLAGQLPPYVAYQGDGDVTAPLVYVNYGMPDDYRALARAGVDVRGKVVIARYGAGWRGLKPKLAQEHGALGCIIYSDPADDGYGVSDVYPAGAQRNRDGVQRGSVVDMTTYPGDPLTPGVGATKDAKRLTREQAVTVLKIPALPISYGDALPLLQALGGPVAPRNMRGGLGLAYHLGDGQGARVRLKVRSDWGLKTLYNVVATMKGSEQPDAWVLRGNHRDGWVFGAEDPISGQVAMMAEAKAIGVLARQGFRPKKTLVYLSWDGEEAGLLGSTEWAEAHDAELQRKAVAYVNSDNSGRGFLSVGGSQAFTRMVNEVADAVTDPQTGVSLRERQRARARVAALEGGDERTRRFARSAAQGGDTPLEALGSGSDYTGFLQHLGVPSMDVRFGGEGSAGGVYHSAYDSYDHYRRFGDPGEAYGVALARTAGRIVLRLSQAEAPPLRFSDTAATFEEYAGELKRLLSGKRERAVDQARLLDARLYAAAADPTLKLRDPDRLPAVPELDWTALDRAVAHLKTAAAAYDALNPAALPAARRARVEAVLQPQEQRLLDAGGLPGRPWFRHLAYAPGVLTGYGAKTFPGVREAIEGDRYPEAQRFIALTAAAVDRYAQGLEQAAQAAR